MTPEATETYNDIVERLDLQYVRLAGEEIRARMFPQPTRIKLPGGGTKDGPVPFPLPVALSYQPGDGTAYSLIFTPLRSIRQVSPIVNEAGAAWFVPSGGYSADGNVKEMGDVLVTKINETDSDFTFVINLAMDRPYLHPSYIAEKCNHANLATASAITVLLRAIAAQEMLDPEHG
jgi:hypothetical protein